MHRGIAITRTTRTKRHARTGRPIEYKVWRVEADEHGNSTRDFDTRAQATAFIDQTIEAEERKVHFDFYGNWWIIRPMNGCFTRIDSNKKGEPK